MLLASALIFAACGTSDSEVEHAIADLPSTQLTEPECDEFDRDLDEATYECSAAQGSGDRIKLMACLKSGDVGLIIAPSSEHPKLRCGMVVWSRRN